MTYRGRIEGGVVVLAPGAELPEGAEVEVVVVPEVKPADQPTEPEPPAGIWAKMVALARWSETLPCNLPTDLAENHDHYLHGTPKRS